MQTIPRGSYLETEVLTATPQKLQLMLIEAAIRAGQQASSLWQQQEEERAAEAMVQCQQIVTELLCSLDPEHDKELTRRIASVYLYVFRTLVTAQLERDHKQLDDALSVLEVERETWQQVCQQLGATQRASTDAPVADAQHPSADFHA